MPIKVEIDDKKIQHYNAQAKHELELKVNLYIDRIVKEANRLESRIRTSGSKSPEITSSIVSDSVIAINREWSKKSKKSLWDNILIVVNTVLAICSGSLFDLEKFRKPETQNDLFWFLGCIITVAVLTVYLNMRENSTNE